MGDHYELGFSWVLEAIFADIKILGNLEELLERLNY